MPQPRAIPGFRRWLAGISWTQFQCCSFVDPVPTTAPSYTFPGLYPAYSGKYVPTAGVDHWVCLVFTLVPLWCARKYVLRILAALIAKLSSIPAVGYGLGMLNALMM